MSTLKEVYTKHLPKLTMTDMPYDPRDVIRELLEAIRAEVEKPTGFEVVIQQATGKKCDGAGIHDLGHTITRPLTQAELVERYVFALYQAQTRMNFCKLIRPCPCSEMNPCLDYQICHVADNPIRRKP
jgi:hypothetical protein